MYHRMQRVNVNMPDTALDPRCQSGPSARNSFDPYEGRFSKDCGADQQRLQISDLHFDKFPDPATFACGKIKFKTEVCTCSQFPKEAVLWIKEVEMVESMGDLKSSRSVRGTHGPKSELLRRENCFSTEENHPEYLLLEKGQSGGNERPKKKTVFLRGRQIPFLIHEQFRVTGTDSSVENYTDLFTIALRNDDIQEFDSKWDGILSSMTQIPFDEILENLCKLRTRESEKLKTVLELNNMEIHQKKLGPDCHRLNTMAKRSIEQEIWNKNFGSRSGNFKKNAVVKNQRAKQRELWRLGDCWQWKAHGQCSKREHCSFRDDMNKRANSTQPNPSPRSPTQQSVKNASRTRSPGSRSQIKECLDCRAKIMVMFDGLNKKTWCECLVIKRTDNWVVCCGSKKWNWLIQWTIWDLRQFVVFQCLILKYSMRGLPEQDHP